VARARASTILENCFRGGWPGQPRSSLTIKGSCRATIIRSRSRRSSIWRIPLPPRMRKTRQPSRPLMKDCGTRKPVELCLAKKCDVSYPSGLPSPLLTYAKGDCVRTGSSLQDLGHFYPLYPQLKRWAKLDRPSGAGITDALFHRVNQKRRVSLRRKAPPKQSLDGAPSRATFQRHHAAL